MSEEEKHQQITFLQHTTEWLVYFIIFTLIIGILSIFYVFNFIQSMDLMISNQTEAKILIESCSLNDIELTNCTGELLPRRNIFFGYDRKNFQRKYKFSINLKNKKETKQYFCTFEKVNRSCIEEIGIRDSTLICAPKCVDIY
ncbi:MAG: hypothetical protein CTY29_07315 [Methylobacter sp.]|nr:MAG: hypothetical protein CTY29_07315 [Methylobacter sp.]